MEKLFETAEVTNLRSSESDVLNNNKENVDKSEAERNMNDDCQMLINGILDISNKCTYDNFESNEEFLKQLETYFEKLGYGDFFRLEKANLSNYIKNLGHSLGKEDITTFFDKKTSRKFSFYYNVKKARTLGTWNDSYNYVIMDLLEKDEDRSTKALSDKEIIEKNTQCINALNEYKKETLEGIDNEKMLLISTVEEFFELDYSSTEELHKIICDKLVELGMNPLVEDMNLIFKLSKNNIDEYKALVYDFLNKDYFDKAFILKDFEDDEDDENDDEDDENDDGDEEYDENFMKELLNDVQYIKEITAQDDATENNSIRAYRQHMRAQIENLRGIIQNEIKGEIKTLRDNIKEIRNSKKEIRRTILLLRKNHRKNKEIIKEKKVELENLSKECDDKVEEYKNLIKGNRNRIGEYRKLINEYKQKKRETVGEIRQERKEEKQGKGEGIKERKEAKKEKKGFSKILDQISNIEYNSLGDLRTKILNICNQEGLDLSDNRTKSLIYLSCDNSIKHKGNNAPEFYIVLYGLACGVDIDTNQDLLDFITTVQSNGSNGRYASQYKNFLIGIGKYYDRCVTKVAEQSLITRYEVASIPNIKRNFHNSDFINFVSSKADNQQDQSGIKVASNIDSVSDKLNHYSFKGDKTKHEEAALKHAAFNITFNNTFNLNNPIVKKLADMHVDLRSDLFKYGIYSQKDNYFNKSAWDKYVTEKLGHLGLSPEEIGQLGNAMVGLNDLVKKNYEILSSNFDADRDNFEKIAKIYALGEIIDNIKNLFTNENILSENLGSGTYIGFEFNENSADIVGDCLILKGKVNGTETTIKYDLRTGKLYMNTLMQQEFNPPKITIGNNEPNTEIGDIGDFDDLLDGYKPTSFSRGKNIKHRKPYNNENKNPYSSNHRNFREVDNEYINERILKRLMKNKLLGKLSKIGKILKEKAGEQSNENAVINSFLKTFNILPDEGNSRTIEFLGGSKLYILLESIKNTNDENHLLEFSKLMNDLMNLCQITRGKNNLLPKDGESKSPSIFDIDKKDATTDIKNLQEAYDNFFSGKNGEKDRLKSCEAHFDQSAQLSFANIIVDKCCGNSGGEWKISIDLAKKFVNDIKQRIDDAQKDKNELIAMENIIDDDSTWT